MLQSSARVGFCRRKGWSVIGFCGHSDAERYQARLTFAIARHAAVDLSLVFKINPVPPKTDRLPAADVKRLRDLLCTDGIDFPEAAAVQARLGQLRAMYEPFVNGLSEYFAFKLPGFLPDRPTADNWQTSAWMPRTPGIRDLPGLEKTSSSFVEPGDHFV